MIIKDTRPQVGIFEIVDGYLLLDTEDYQTISHSGDFFDGTVLHLHEQEVKNQVRNHPNISEETKAYFRINRGAYLEYPRGRVDYNTKTGKFHLMASQKFFKEQDVERVLRAFYLPPKSSDKLVFEADEMHYGY